MSCLNQFYLLALAFIRADSRRRSEILDIVAGRHRQASENRPSARNHGGGKWAIVDIGKLPPEDEGFPFSENNWQPRVLLENAGDVLYVGGREVSLIDIDCGNRNFVKGDDVLERLSGQRLEFVPAIILCRIMEDTDLIPGGWKEGERIIIFPGTFFGSSGGRCVAFMRFFEGKWRWKYVRTGKDWPIRGIKIAVFA